MLRTVTMTSVLGLLALGVGVGNVSAAPPMAGFVGEAPSSVAGCPLIVWHLARHDDGSITGIVYFSDLSGLSQATGNINQQGQFQLQLTSTQGKGPVGAVQGVRGASKTTATLKGEGCANAQITHFNPVPDINVAVASKHD